MNISRFMKYRINISLQRVIECDFHENDDVNMNFNFIQVISVPVRGRTTKNKKTGCSNGENYAFSEELIFVPKRFI